MPEFLNIHPRIPGDLQRLKAVGLLDSDENCQLLYHHAISSSDIPALQRAPEERSCPGKAWLQFSGSQEHSILSPLQFSSKGSSCIVSGRGQGAAPRDVRASQFADNRACDIPDSERASAVLL